MFNYVYNIFYIDHDTRGEMSYFVYGSRLIENERQVRLKKYARKIGNLLRAVAAFFATIFLFLFMLVLPNLVQHVDPTLLKLLAFIFESLEHVIAHGVLPVVSTVIGHHSFCCVLAIVVTCVFNFATVAMAQGSCELEQKQEQEAYHFHRDELHRVAVCNTVSYKFKVCFLS